MGRFLQTCSVQRIISASLKRWQGAGTEGKKAESKLYEYLRDSVQRKQLKSPRMGVCWQKQRAE